MLRAGRTCLLLFLLPAVCLLAGCAMPTGPYVPTDETGIATMGVDPQDVRLVVEEMITQMFNEWDFAETQAGKLPVIAVGRIRNDSPHNVNVREIHGWIQDVILMSRKATFSTATDYERRGGTSGDLYKQIDFQSDPDNEYVDKSTTVRKGRVIGADYNLFGEIHYYKGRENWSTRESNHVFEMTLEDIGRGIVVWKGMKPIRKNIRKY